MAIPEYVNNNQTQLAMAQGKLSLTDLQESLDEQNGNYAWIDFDSFPTISKKGTQFSIFSIRGDSAFCDEEIYIKIIALRDMSVLIDDSEDGSEIIRYSYDGISTTGIHQYIDSLMDEMIERNEEPKLREQLVILCQLVNRSDKYNKRLFLLPVQPSSNRIARSFITHLNFTGTLKANPETIIKVSKGALKKTVIGNYTYFPWQFDVADVADDAAKAA